MLVQITKRYLQSGYIVYNWSFSIVSLASFLLRTGFKLLKKRMQQDSKKRCCHYKFFLRFLSVPSLFNLSFQTVFLFAHSLHKIKYSLIFDCKGISILGFPLSFISPLFLDSSKSYLVAFGLCLLNIIAFNMLFIRYILHYITRLTFKNFT